MNRASDPVRRALLAAATALPWTGCAPAPPVGFDGAWVGAAHERGHRLREASRGVSADAAAGAVAAPHAHGATRRANVLVVGAGIAGLAAARALGRSGIDDVHVFDLEDAAGGNSRGHSMGGMACQLGAHYLPLPGEQATEVAQWLAELGLSRGSSGSGGPRVYDERHLCHSPQERLYIEGQWVEGLLPPLEALPQEQRAETLRQYQRFEALVEAAGRDNAFSVPTARARSNAATSALDAFSFADWLTREGIAAAPLRWYLDYCCRDDYGAGARFVSAWAGLHYFASRHGFHAPGSGVEERDGVLTWAEGNAWLVARLAAGLGERMHTGQLALRIVEQRHDARVEVWNAATHAIDRWTAGHIVLAVPLFIAARLLLNPSAALVSAAARLHSAPWLVANLQLREPLVDRGGAAPAWDNVIYDSATLGYVDAMHQSTRPHPGPTVLTAYWALGGDTPGELLRQRQRLLGEPWSVWANAVLQQLAPAHPEIAAHIKRIDLMRYGHAMAIPSPGVRGDAALHALAETRGRVRFAHSDLSGYSVFEEAHFHGERVARSIALELARKPRQRDGVARRG